MATAQSQPDGAPAANPAMNPAPNMAGKVVLITGATGGIGLIAAQVLATQGAEVVLVSRSAQKCETTAAQIKAASGNDKVSYIAGDLALMAQVRMVAEQFLARHDRLDVLINNAGAVFASRQVTAEGHEMTMALNHLNYFYLTQLLQDVLLASAPARIVNVSSDAHKAGSINFDDMMSARKYSSFGVYSMSKLANVLFTYELARRLEDSGVTANALHPGFVASNFGRSNGGMWGAIMPLIHRFAITPEKGAETTIHLAGSPSVEGVTGKYFVKKQAVPSSKASYDTAVQRRLWDVSGQLVREVVKV
jgi:NAD(P)-dependent dehydrogenase (short-subunit alcohol dehydrogenase family)